MVQYVKDPNWKTNWTTIDHNIPQRKAKISENYVALKNNPKKALPDTGKRKVNQIKRNSKPKASAGNVIETIINDCDREPHANTTTLNTESGTYSTRSGGVGAFARATVTGAETSASVARAGARVLNVEAGAYASAFGASAYANAELAVVEADVEADVAGVGVKLGLKLNTGAHIGADGVGVELLGFGVAVGPKTAIKTPIGDVSCSIMWF